MSLFNSNLGSEKIRRILKRRNVTVFFSGVLGAGMLPLAELLEKRGVRVFGNDRRDYAGEYSFLPVTMPLSSVPRADLAVYSLAISEDDADIVEAKKRGIPLVSRAELLGAVMHDYPIRIGVSGTHGKSTTVAMLDTIMRASAMRGVTLSGAELPGGGALSSDGDGFFLYEACEYKNSFLKTHPTVAVITNAELDHTDFFGSDEDIARSFAEFAMSATDYVIIGNDSPLSARILELIGNNAYTVGKGIDADFQYKISAKSDTGCRFELLFLGVSLGVYSLLAFGEHNVANASAALAAAYLCGVDIKRYGCALESFSGIPRRLELLGEISGRSVWYDYAHHPTEISAAIRSLRAREGKVCCIFRPHTYTRTASLWDNFAGALRLSDSSIILDIYPARETPIPGIDAVHLANAVGVGCVYQNFDSAVNYCLQNTSGAIVLMGAGEVEDIKNELLALILKNQ